MPLLYREATEADLSALCALGQEVNLIHHAAWPHIFAGPGRPERDKAQWASSIDQPNATTFVAESEGQVIAFATVSVHDETHSLLQAGRYARVGSVCVAEGERGKGIGPALMALTERWAISQKARDLRLNVWAFNEHALHVYAELGFVQRSFNLGKLLASPAPEG
jgi:GNAT superfamily N-acetyltransferase